MLIETGKNVTAKSREGIVVRHRQFGLRESMVVKYTNGNKGSFFGQTVNKVSNR